MSYRLVRDCFLPAHGHHSQLSVHCEGNGRGRTAGVHSAHFMRFCLPACRWNMHPLGMQDSGHWPSSIFKVDEGFNLYSVL